MSMDKGKKLRESSSSKEKDEIKNRFRAKSQIVISCNGDLVITQNVAGIRTDLLNC